MSVVAWLGFVQVFTIPSGSNVPALQIGDVALGLCYRTLCRIIPSGLPALPLNEPQTGDMAVFRKPSDPSIDDVKRIIGLPGDRVQTLNGRLTVNDALVPQRPLEDFSTMAWGGTALNAHQFEATLANGVSYRILDITPAVDLDTTIVSTVPPNRFFVLGDNRDATSDSRDANGGTGFVPRINMIARMDRVLISTTRLGRVFWPVVWQRRPGGLAVR